MPYEEGNEPLSIVLQREECLQEIAKVTASENVFLWLLDISSNTNKIILANHICSKENNRSIVGSEIIFEKDIFFNDSKIIDDDLEIEMRIFLSENGFLEDEYSIVPLTYPLDIQIKKNSPKRKIMPTGYIAVKNILESNNVSENITNKLEILSLLIDSDRKNRVINAVNATQEFLDDSSNNIDQSLMSIGNMVKKRIRAKRFIYKNKNTSTEWKEVIGSDLEIKTDDIEIEYEGDQNIEKGLVQKVSAKIESEQTKVKIVEMVVVPLLQASFLLKNMPFTDQTDIFDRLENSSTNDITLIFLDKDKKNHLNSYFSDTDLAVARSVFGYIEHYASARIFDENYGKILKYLTKFSLEESAVLSNILELLISLSTSFSNVFLLSAEYEEDGLQVDFLSANQSSKLSLDYIQRIKKEYLGRYNEENKLNSDKLVIGFDSAPNGFDIEFHFPGEDGTSKIFVVRYDSNEITESIFKSLIHLFNEIQVRIKKIDHQIDRASYLMQVRHAVIHHFAAANKSMKVLRPMWAKGSKNKSYWDALLDDPIVSGLISRSSWSLAQAQLIIENGRFLLKDINPNTLNRKQFKLIDLINDCLSTLQDQRDDKALKIKSKIAGPMPSVMNSDETLLRIAMLNLFDNAFKYSPYNRNIMWSVLYEEQSYKFEITSYGEPLDKSRKDQLFQVGTRGKQKDHLNQRHGTGLGLPVAYRILYAHSSQAVLDFRSSSYDESVEGPSNTFFFTMPYLTGQTKR